MMNEMIENLKDRLDIINNKPADDRCESQKSLVELLIGIEEREYIEMLESGLDWDDD